MIDSSADADPPSDGVESEKSEREPLAFDLGLLADPTADPERRNGEWFRFCGHFEPRLVSYFQGRADPEELEETIAHIWRTAFLYIGRLRSPAAVWSWLTTVGENFLNSQRGSAADRRKTREAALPKLQLEEEIRRESESVLDRLAAADPFDEGRWPIDRSTLRERWSRLDGDERWLIHMRVHEELEFAAIAQRMGISNVAARKRFSRAIRTLREG